MLTLTAESVLSVLRDNLHILLALVAFLPTLVLVRTWFRAISLAVQLFGMPRRFSHTHTRVIYAVCPHYGTDVQIGSPYPYH